MSKVTYLSHCGFAITTDEAILVFDYLRDPSHALHRILEQNPNLPVVFFISHRLFVHRHFNAGVYEIAQNHRRIFVVSTDVPGEYIPSTLEVATMTHGDVVQNLPGIKKVEAFKTTEKGVSFMITLNNEENIFFAGELNDWDMPDETGMKEFKREDNIYRSIVNHIAEEYPEVDIAMMNVNPRISLDYARGARILCDAIKIKNFFPMDIDGDIKEACDFKSYLPDGVTGHCLRVPGESIKL